MAAPANRQKLWFGIWSGFAVAIGFAILACALAVFDLVEWRWVYFELVGGKLATNALPLLRPSKKRPGLGAPKPHTRPGGRAGPASARFTRRPVLPPLPA